MIKFNRVYKVFERDIQALSDISFEVKRGEFVFITGPSGAGKTTILNLLYREDLPTMGAIFVDSLDITHIGTGRLPAYRRGIGFVFQDFKLLFDRPLFENIALPLVVRGENMEYVKKLAQTMIDRIGLTGKESLNPWHLSGGEKQKAAIARALITSPPILLADEPTGNLDDYSSWEIMEMLTEANRAGTTVIIASHNKEIMSKLGHRIIRLDKGKVVSDAMG
ncbi:MAG TPA: ATP-binding cassette domain-containing protein [bacterium]|nr:ATP-binding cassette domain-containing protein [bacterium]